MSIQTSTAAIDTAVDFKIPAPRTASSTARVTRPIVLAPEPEAAATPSSVEAESGEATTQSRPLAVPLAVLGTVLLLCGCGAAASFVVVAGPVMPMVAVGGILFGLFVIGQAVGRRPASDEMYDVR